MPTILLGHTISGNDESQPYAASTKDLPILPTRNLVLFPHVTIPISLCRPASLALANEAEKKHFAIGIVCQKEADIENPTLKNLHSIGVVADVIKVIDLPDGTQSALVRARDKIKITGEGLQQLLEEPYISASFRTVKDTMPKEDDRLFRNVILSEIYRINQHLIEEELPGLPAMPKFDPSNNDEVVAFLNSVATNAPFTIEQKVELLKINSFKKRGQQILSLLIAEEYKNGIVRELSEKVHRAFDREQKRAFLQKQMEIIQEELDINKSDYTTLMQEAEKAGFPKPVYDEFQKELSKLTLFNPQSPEYGIQVAYLRKLINLPWNKQTETTKTFPEARDILEADHYGLKKVKERILEQLAVVMHNPEASAPIICFVGPPGVGKTSLGMSVAKALDRKFGRISLGGVSDEAEIRGHRRTYIGAMPGRIINVIEKTGSRNPVLMLDEIDKLGQNFKGDPSAALLEVLDPEQNHKFHDNYIDIDFDLSSVMFIATANDLSTVPGPLRDRMEIIELSGYLPEEKREIARLHLIPRQLKAVNLEKEAVSFTDAAIDRIVMSYTAESGVRQLDKQIAALLRKVVKEMLETGDNNPRTIDDKDVISMLGVELYNTDKYEGNDYAGVATGLAWTAAGGDILFIEASLSAGSGKLSTTGQLGDVMKESATIAYQYVKANASRLEIDPDVFSKYDVHIHVPAGAVPKDGPSAGVTLVTALVSAFKQVRVKARLAMTGEITLRGRVLAVGGIREKLLAARRAGIKEVILPDECRKYVKEIDPQLIKGLKLHFVSQISEVLKLALTDDVRL